MTETSSHIPPPYTSTESTDGNIEAPPPYQAILSDNPAPSFPNPPPLFNTLPPPFPTPPPSFGYQIPPPSYTHSNNFQSHLDNRISGLVLVDGLHSNDNEEEPERENSSTVLLYTLAVLTCVVCGFFAGLLFIVLILLGEKRSTMPMGKRRKYYLLVSLVVSMVSFFFVFVVISWFGYFLKPMPFGTCKFGISMNKTCCPASIPAFMCHQGVMKKTLSGCRVCCTSEACQAEWVKDHCGVCQDYSTKVNSKGCPQCCNQMSCGKRGAYRNAFNCSSCCPSFDSDMCLSKAMEPKMDGKTGCRVCCSECLHGTSTYTDKSACKQCCPAIAPECKHTYKGTDGCDKCCDSETVSKCKDASVDNLMCDQCCAGDSDIHCGSNNTTEI